MGQQSLQEHYDQIIADPQPDKLAQFTRDQQFYEEILYLSMKFMSKVLKPCFSIFLRQQAYLWANIAINRIAGSDSEYEGQTGSKGSPTFNHFHCKKWSFKYLKNFLCKILIYKKTAPEVESITRKFYN